MNNAPEVVVGFIAYGPLTAKYLPYFLPSLKGQTFGDFKIAAVDNTEGSGRENIDYLRDKFPEVEIERSGENLGFARAYNRIMKRAVADGASYFLAVNPDMVFSSDMLERLVETAKKTGAAAVQPKVLRWDFSANSRTDIIDSLGVSAGKGFYFYDHGQGERDSGPEEGEREIFGFTGAAVLFDLAALDRLAPDGEYFDELMFMYKEDCDLSLRLRLAGNKVFFDPSAVAFHDRTASASRGLAAFFGRFRRGRKIKKWSFLNQWIIFSKYRGLPFSWRVKTGIFFHKLKLLVFAFLFEQYLFKELLKLRGMEKEIRKKREALQVKVDISEIEKIMEQKARL